MPTRLVVTCELQALVLGGLSHRVHDALDQRRHVNGLARQPQFPGHGRRHVQQVANQAGLQFSAALDGVQRAHALGLCQLAGAQQLDASRAAR